MPLRSRLAFRCALLALIVPAACKKPGRLDLMLRPAENLDLTAIDEIEVRLLDGRDDRELDRGTVTGADLAALPNLFAKSSIDPGVPYVFEVRADVAGDVCESGRVVGRSLPVEVEGDESHGTATMYVACADAVAPTGRMHDARAGHAAIWAPAQGGAVLVGGASDVQLPNMNHTPLDSVEIYDPATGRFDDAPALREPRFVPGAGLDAEGRVVVMGGTSERLAFFGWLDTVEEIDGEARRGKGLLDTKWAHPIVLPLNDGTFALLGIGLDGLVPLAQATFYDPATETNERGYLRREPGDAYNLMAVPMPGRDRALLASAGDNPLTPEPEQARPSLFCLDGCCEERGPCFVPLGDEQPSSSWGPGAGWKDAAGAFLACPDGGGVVVLTGGQLGDHDPIAPLDGIWCYEDAEGAPSREGLTRIGSLKHARVLHGVVAIRPNRLLVAGGFAALDDGLEQAEILNVDPCSCAPLSSDDVSETTIDPSLGDIGRLYFGGSDVVLGDGSVLLTGAASIGADGVIDADDDAWVFMPDLPD